ncbi:uncharacterized protein K452DRAFT_323924 [Aplosporella prunicola CBS 121167]|uniref:DNA mismatch repair protein S5 domain-containing protein n=1 Tax=Aplosporella prunicola CBS 121167 TaxID=1176127 RepID=A0A6A6BVI5_9PEZI|nr:uncharacterized protein K452DRAFT_323924 [Aplosporella prunicola CBS 121167]KAF2146867.1 hypothetical protein K452DRAFT_323924 [Aplosporella prunicola CBS 121167]
MPIAALPPSAVRQIGSTQVLVDPSSVVKELIDNSLDARATNISVEISTNTIDVIQVRDNGHSIPAEDRPMVCRRYCTSKIRDFSDLKDLGGKCLGFRGEALASLAEMCGSLSITVRAEGEPVAALLKIGRSGNIESQEKMSHPVGTTVRAANFFQGLPVRKQDALKHSAKYLKHIKHLMQAYALARPATRFSLRVLKSKSDKANFIYAPKPGASVEDAAYKIIGINSANQCTWSILESRGFGIEAFLPKPNGEAAKVGNLGQFISVDSRPVSTMRGTFKQIASLFKEKLKRSSASFEGVKDPFLCMNIICPPDSYDPNIEPAKDDVMFDDAAKVVEAVEELLQVRHWSASAGE